MSDRLDKELGRHIQAVFDAYDEPFDAVNWQRLQRKRQTRTVVFYLKRAGVAAAVALLLSTGIVLWNKAPVMDEGSLAENGQPSAEQPAQGGLAPEGEESGPAGTVSGEVQAETASGETVSGEIAGESGSGERFAESVSGESGSGESLAEAALERSASERRPAEALLTENGREAGESGSARPLLGNASVAPEQLAGGNTAPDLKIVLPSPAGDSPAVLFPDGFIIREPVAAAPQAGSMAGRPERAEQFPDAVNPRGNSDQSLPEEKNLSEFAQANLDREREKEDAGGRFSVGFVTTSLMNYASGNTANEVHFGAGLTSGLKLNDKFSLHSGFILAENSLSLNKSNSSVRSSSHAMFAAPSEQLSSASKNSIVQKVSPNSMDVNLLVVDIPLNVTYRVDVGRSDLLITGGLSSFAYLDQEYSYYNTVQLYTDATVDAPEPVIRDENAFSHFDFAKQLNLAIGTEVSLGKGTMLILEPYVKYPLGELTSEHIRFGSAGMNLRLSFGKK